MKKKITLYITILILFLSNLTLFNQVSAAPNLENTVQARLGNENISVSIRSLQTGNVIYEKNANTGMKPASTLKLLTASAALDVLGPDFRFLTKVYIDGEVENNVLKGDLYIRGGGDPTLRKENFVNFAIALKRNGIRTITGNIYGDDFAFSGSQLTPGIYPEDESYYYAARTSALTMSPNDDYDAGTIIIHAKPSSIGKPPKVEAEPNTSGMRIMNRAKTVRKGQKATIHIERKYRTNQIIITGNLPIGRSAKEWVTLYDPTINTLLAMKTTIEGTGIKFSETTSVKRQEVPESAKLIYTKQSLPLKTLMIPFMKLSNNSIADILVKTMGLEVYGKGHINYGLEVLNDYGESIGLQMNKWKLEDGSGISHRNNVSANELTKILYTVRNDESYQVFYNSLPIGGQTDRFVGGSLNKRFNTSYLRNRVIAKTGGITGVNTLAGYVTAKSGRTYAFAIMTQYQPTSQISNIDAVVNNIISLY